MNTHSQILHDKIYSITQNIPVYRGDNWHKFHQKSKYVNDVMSSKSDLSKVNCWVFNNNNWKMYYCNLRTLMKLFLAETGNVMELIQNWDNQNQQAKNFQIRYNLSKFNNQNYQTLSAIQQRVSNSLNSVTTQAQTRPVE